MTFQNRALECGSGHTHARHHIMVSMDNFRTDPSMDVELQYILPA